MSVRRRSFSRSPVRYRDRGQNRNFRPNREIRPVNWDSHKLSKIYTCSSVLSGAIHDRSKDELDSFRKDNEIKISSCMKVAKKFSEFNFPDCIDKRLKELEWDPLPLQAQTIPIILEGHDLFVNSKTGTGKALSFIIPVICHTLEQIKHSSTSELGDTGSGKSPISLILVPTREIAEYIEHCMNKFSQNSDVVISAIYGGGGSRSLQRDSVNKNPNVIIATPGRLMDFLESEFVDLKGCSMLVFYETDRMLDMGFESKIKTISTQIRPDRKLAIFTTRTNQDVDYIVKRLSKSPVELFMDHKKLINNQKVRQMVEVLTPARKFDKLCEILKRIDKLQAFIFVETIRGADYLKEKLRDKNYYVGSIHVEKSSKEREQTFEKLRSGSLDIIVATDLASRGIDLNNMNCIVNYDYPPLTEDYKNRLVRVCRSESKVSVYSFFHTRNGKLAKELIKVLDEAREKIPEPLKKISKDGYMGGNRRRYRYSYSSSKSRSKSPRKSARSPRRSFSRSRSNSSVSRSVSSSSSRSKSASRSGSNSRSVSKSLSNRSYSSRKDKSNRNGKSHARSSQSSSASSRASSSKSENMIEKKRSRSISSHEPAAKIARSVISEKMDQDLSGDERKSKHSISDKEEAEGKASRSSSPTKSPRAESAKSQRAESAKSPRGELAKSPLIETSKSPRAESAGSKSSRSKSNSSDNSKSSRSPSKSSIHRSSSNRSKRKRSISKNRNYRRGIASKSSSRSRSTSRSVVRNRKSSRSYSRRRRSPSYRGRPRGTTKKYSRRRSPSYRKRTPSYRRRSPVRRNNRRSPSPQRNNNASLNRSSRKYIRRSSNSPQRPNRSKSLKSNSSRSLSKSVSPEKKKPANRQSLSVSSNRSEKSTSPNNDKRTGKKKKKNGSDEDEDSDDDSDISDKESKKAKKKAKKAKKKAKKIKKKEKKKAKASEEVVVSGGGSPSTDEKKKKKKKKKVDSSEDN